MTDDQINAAFDQINAAFPNQVNAEFDQINAAFEAYRRSQPFTLRPVTGEEDEEEELALKSRLWMAWKAFEAGWLAAAKTVSE